MAEELGSSTLTGHGEKCTATMGAEVRPAFVPRVVLAVVSVESKGKSSHVLTFDLFIFLPRTDFASQLISMDSDGTMYPSTQMLHWSP